MSTTEVFGAESSRIRTLRVRQGGLADRLAVVRAAERQTGVAVECGHVGCHTQASSRVRGIAFCAGHAGFAAVRGMVA